VGSTVGTKQRYIRPIDPQPQPAGTADELRSEVSYVQNLLGTEKRRVVELEELVTSLQRELAVAKAELTTAAAVCQQLQIELDAAQQVPADSPDLQQWRLRLADMTLDRDQYKDAWNQIFTDLTTIKETTKAETVEAITEWLQPFRGCNSPALALLLLEALPHIIRSLTGLNPEEIE
jgi:thioredoxin-like negative regulator of GroEL